MPADAMPGRDVAGAKDARVAPAGVLPRGFFSRPADEVAPDLLGCVLEHQSAEGPVAVALTEVEAYAGQADPASHAYRGQTARNAVMFGPPGHAYVYFSYGMHFCVNVVCQPAGTASAVLLRAGSVVAGEALARQRRALRRTVAGGVVSMPVRELARGPARLCQALGIDRSLDGADLCAPSSALRLRPAGRDADAEDQLQVSAGPRVGVSGAVDIPWRFWTEGDPTVSVYRPHVRRRR